MNVAMYEERVALFKNEGMSPVEARRMALTEITVINHATADEVRKACHNFNQHCMTANLLHLVETDTFDIVESYISPVDMILNDVVIKAGSWMSVLQIYSDEIWSEIKDGNLTGVSIGATANTEYLDEE